MKVTLSLPAGIVETEEVKAWLRHAERAIEAELTALEYNLLVCGLHTVVEIAAGLMPVPLATPPGASE